VESSTHPERKEEVLIYLVECSEQVPGHCMFMEEGSGRRRRSRD
jgi:hypothetical protein